MGVGEIQVRLVGKKTVPVIGLRFVVPLPVGFLGIGEDDARAAVLRIVVAPDVVVPLARTRRRMSRRLEPGMLVRSVVDYQFGDYAQPAAMGLVDERWKSAIHQRRMHVV